MTTSLHTSGLAIGGARATNPLTHLIRFAGQALALRRERTRLARLDDRALADMGVARTEALTEAARPVWDVPTYWRG